MLGNKIIFETFMFFTMSYELFYILEDRKKIVPDQQNQEFPGKTNLSQAIGLLTNVELVL